MSGRYWTPYQVEIMLHHHTSRAPFPRWTAPGYPVEIENLVDLGVLRLVKHGADFGGNQYATTKLGAALIELWLQTPLPREIIIDPRSGHEVMTEHAGFVEDGVKAKASDAPRTVCVFTTAGGDVPVMAIPPEAS